VPPERIERLVAARERGEMARRGNPTGANQHGGNLVNAEDSSARLRDVGLTYDRAAQATRLAAVPPVRIGTVEMSGAATFPWSG
jgi:hypothetical protein